MIHLEGIDASIIKSNQFLTNDQLFCLKIVENDLFVILGSQNRPITRTNLFGPRERTPQKEGEECDAAPA